MMACVFGVAMIRSNFVSDDVDFLEGGIVSEQGFIGLRFDGCYDPSPIPEADAPRQFYDTPVMFFATPHWVIVLLLTIVSAYMILRKPRSTQPPKSP